MSDLFSAWTEFPTKLLSMQQAYLQAVSDATDAGFKTVAAMHANQTAAEAGLKAFGSWTSLLNQAP